MKKQRGGRREGAGRPKGDGKMYSFRAEKELSDYIEGHTNKTEFIRGCISMVMEADRASDSQGLEPIGEVFPASRIKPLNLPFFDISVVAGFPIPLSNDEMAQDIELLRMLCPHPEASYLIRVQGDSMTDAGISNGDIIIVDKSNRNPAESEVAVCELNGEYTIKHFVRDGNKAWLVPANPKYPKLEIMPDDDFSVWGTVTYIIHKPRR